MPREEMPMSQDLRIQHAHSALSEPEAAVREIAGQLDTAADAVLFFCSPAYDLVRLGRALRESSPGHLAG